MQMAVVPHVLAECMYGHYHTKLAVRLTGHLAQVFKQAFVGDLAKTF
jgi:hypothetical protein